MAPMHAKPLLYALLCAGAAVSGACGDARRDARSGEAPRTAMIQNAQAESARPAAPHLPLKIAPDLTVRTVHFGLLKSEDGADDEFVATDDIPAVDGQAFGWIIEVDTTRKSLHWQEHLRMPEPPADWGDAAGDPDIVISKDGKSVVAQGQDDVDDNELSRFYWSLATGDPAGEYQMDVAVEGHPVAHIRFRVAAKVREQTLLVRRARPPHEVRFVQVAQRQAPRRAAARHGIYSPWS